MQEKSHIRKNDTVIAIAGKERFSKKTGKVLKVFPQKGRAIVEGFNLAKRHMRPTQKNPKGGIVERERSINITNVMLYCSKCGKGVRVGYKVLGDGSKVRYCKRCGDMVDKG
jgi:large subunit ribosomal protein L24